MTDNVRSGRRQTLACALLLHFLFFLLLFFQVRFQFSSSWLVNVIHIHQVFHGSLKGVQGFFLFKLQHRHSLAIRLRSLATIFRRSCCIWGHESGGPSCGSWSGWTISTHDTARNVRVSWRFGSKGIIHRSSTSVSIVRHGSGCTGVVLRKQCLSRRSSRRCGGIPRIGRRRGIVRVRSSRCRRRQSRVRRRTCVRRRIGRIHWLRIRQRGRSRRLVRSCGIRRRCSTVRLSRRCRSTVRLSRGCSSIRRGGVRLRRRGKDIGASRVGRIAHTQRFRLQQRRRRCWGRFPFQVLL
mmetsp:Transcript_20876/g.45264  ORF Transcript_20876/g.45264 Transcript_20876/m.45264 type:complete len:295 (-) Transcript_20876:615-1499(-)